MEGRSPTGRSAQADTQSPGLRAGSQVVAFCLAKPRVGKTYSRSPGRPWPCSPAENSFCRQWLQCWGLEWESGVSTSPCRGGRALRVFTAPSQRLLGTLGLGVENGSPVCSKPSVLDKCYLCCSVATCYRIFPDSGLRPCTEPVLQNPGTCCPTFPNVAYRGQPLHSRASACRCA